LNQIFSFWLYIHPSGKIVSEEYMTYESTINEKINQTQDYPLICDACGSPDIIISQARYYTCKSCGIEIEKAYFIEDTDRLFAQSVSHDDIPGSEQFEMIEIYKKLTYFYT
jgi:ribosomal protein L37AE/L43A